MDLAKKIAFLEAHDCTVVTTGLKDNQVRVLNNYGSALQPKETWCDSLLTFTDSGVSEEVFLSGTDELKGLGHYETLRDFLGY